MRFYDGICQWEEGSHTPILHIGWAKQLCFSISKFDYDIRSQVKIILKSDYDDDNNNKKVTEAASPRSDTDHHQPLKKNEPLKSPTTNGKNDFSMLPSLDELTAACREKILNPDFLLHGGGVPFSEPTPEDTNGVTTDGDKKECLKIDTNSVKSPKFDDKVLSPAQKDLASPHSAASPQIIASPAGVDTLKSEEDQSNDTNNNDDFDLHTPKRPIITLKSRKMKGLKDLLLAEKLNTNAISLQITAQSHIGSKKSRSCSANDDTTIADGSRPKRTRRE